MAYPGFEVERHVDEARANVYEHADPDRRSTPVRDDRIRELLPHFPAHDPPDALEDFLAWIETHADFVVGSAPT